MRGYFIRVKREKRILAFVLWAAFFLAVSGAYSDLIKQVAEGRLSELVGADAYVRIGEVRGGVFGNIQLDNVSFLKPGTSREIARIGRVEISYRVWRPLAKKAGLGDRLADPAPSVTLYFGKTNPVIQGFVEITSSGEGIYLIGNVAPVFLKDAKKSGFKGVIERGPDGKLYCDLFFEGNMTVSGAVDLVSRMAELDVHPGKEGGAVKIKAEVDGDNKANVYLRADKLIVRGHEVIGDAWVSYENSRTPHFLARAENVMIDRRSWWDIKARINYVKQEKTILIKELKLGEIFDISGSVELSEPHGSDIVIKAENFEISSFAEMLGVNDSKFPLTGTLDAEVSIEGPLREPMVKGRILAGAGKVGAIEFKSFYAALAGKYPVLSIVDSRISKEGGCLILGGEADFSRPGGNKFEHMTLEADDRLAFLGGWEITSPEGDNSLEATWDNFTVNASIKEYGSGGSVPVAGGVRDKGSVGVKYYVDGGNSVKLERNEDRDLIGVEHKVQF